jgi:hypothetical protein
VGVASQTHCRPRSPEGSSRPFSQDSRHNTYYNRDEARTDPNSIFLTSGKIKICQFHSRSAEILDDYTSSGTFPNLRNSIATLLSRETYLIRMKRKKLRPLGRFHM